MKTNVRVLDSGPVFWLLVNQPFALQGQQRKLMGLQRRSVKGNYVDVSSFASIRATYLESGVHIERVSDEAVWNLTVWTTKCRKRGEHEPSACECFPQSLKGSPFLAGWLQLCGCEDEERRGCCCLCSADRTVRPAVTLKGKSRSHGLGQ